MSRLKSNERFGGRSDARSHRVASSAAAFLSLPALVLVALFASANAYAGSVDLTMYLQNGNFALGPAPTGSGSTWTTSCPIDWNCPGSTPGSGFTPYQPDMTNGTQYIPGLGSDGLPSPDVTPNGAVGTWAAEAPIIEGNGNLIQSSSTTAGYTYVNSLLGTWQQNTTYTLELWYATPLTVFDDNGNTAAPATDFVIQFLGSNGDVLPDNGGGSNNAEQNLTVPTTLGLWAEQTITFTPTNSFDFQSANDAVGFEISVAGGAPPPASNNDLVDDIDFQTNSTPSSTPEPGTSTLIGIALIGLAYGFRRKLSRNN